MLALEEKQDEIDIILKFLQKDRVENLFLKVSAGQEINVRAHKYLHIDQADLIEKNKTWLKTFLENKYFSNIKDKSFPELIERKVAKHNKEIKILRENLEQTDPEKAQHLDVVVKSLGDLINDSRPTFLFGEIGSGKSTLLAHHFLNELEGEILPIFIPSTYLKGYDLKTILVRYTSIKPYIKTNALLRIMGSWNLNREGDNQSREIENYLNEIDEKFNDWFSNDPDRAIQTLLEIGGNIFLLNNIDFELLKTIDKELIRQIKSKFDYSNYDYDDGYFWLYFDDFSYNDSDWNGFDNVLDSFDSDFDSVGCSSWDSGCSSCSGCGGCGGCS